MDPDNRWVIPLAEAGASDEQFIGGKAAKLAQLARGGFRVPGGFSITTQAYEAFVRENNLARVIRMELGRKPLASMRWEEVWDTALRIRSAFLAAPILPALAETIAAAARQLGVEKPLAVRSSAPGEDSAHRSFAGLHESVVGVAGQGALLDAVRVVWASLWSDAALFYRQELALDPNQSRMAVVVQEVVDEDRSGVAFGRDPRQPSLEQAIVECVPGPCGDLVDGIVDPDRWILDRTTGEVLSWRPGERKGEEEGEPILAARDLDRLLKMLLDVESAFGWSADTEWTGREERFTLLQARPITTGGEEADDPRSWYLTLRPGARRLSDLAVRVVERLIPELEALGERLTAEPVEDYRDSRLADAIAERGAALERWRRIYLDDFIPFAHGVRQLGIYYNDAVRPQDPYEFVGLLKGEQMIASQRNEALASLAHRVRNNPGLADGLRKAADASSRAGDGSWREVLKETLGSRDAQEILVEVDALLGGFLDVAYGGERLSDRPDLVLSNVLEMASAGDQLGGEGAPPVVPEQVSEALEEKLLRAVGSARRDEALEVLKIGRLSWRLRDDDNVLVGRLESQLLRTLNLAAERLRAAGRLQHETQVTIPAAPILATALRDPASGMLRLPEPEPEQQGSVVGTGESPRQLVGQPAAPGLATGRVRVVQNTEDLGLFQAGEVLVCDAIQPTMTHLVPLACAIVERRGGMLIHGAIIARELGIPCANGIANATELLRVGDIVTVDGYLGIVTVGPPEFELEGV